MMLSNITSRLFGRFASTPFPSFIQNIINSSYVKLMKLDMKEFDSPSSYPTLNALFTRKLKNKREFPKDEKSIISPCDAFVTKAGKIDKNRAFQIKGFEYKIDSLLKKIEEEKIKKIYNGEYVNFYLSPKDYHRYHAPMDMRVKKAIHIPGALYPVNFTYLNKISDLFIKNERVVLECEDKEGMIFFMVFVGALNVGKIVFHFDERIHTNAKKRDITVYKYDSLFLKKGEEIGYFMIGSTIVIFFEKEKVKLTVKENDKVKFSDIIAYKIK